MSDNAIGPRKLGQLPMRRRDRDPHLWRRSPVLQVMQAFVISWVERRDLKSDNTVRASEPMEHGGKRKRGLKDVGIRGDRHDDEEGTPNGATTPTLKDHIGSLSRNRTQNSSPQPFTSGRSMSMTKIREFYMLRVPSRPCVSARIRLQTRRKTRRRTMQRLGFP